MAAAGAVVMRAVRSQHKGLPSTASRTEAGGGAQLTAATRVLVVLLISALRMVVAGDVHRKGARNRREERLTNASHMVEDGGVLYEGVAAVPWRPPSGASSTAEASDAHRAGATEQCGAQV
jgi:hypothetical protein